MKFRAWATVMLAGIFFASATVAQETGTPSSEAVPTEGQKAKVDITDLSLEELLNEEISVATAKPLTIREIPAVITVVNRDDLQRLGIRDLIDVLRLVPGFEPASDVHGTVGMGFRGNWAYEGKVLVLLDGHNMVEPAYTNVPLGNRFPVDLIERIEIIRGPGSAIYGREAELAVINIITRTGKEFSGVSGAYSSGYLFQGDTARQNFSASAGHFFKDDLYVGASIFKGYGLRSDNIYRDIYGVDTDFEYTNKLYPYLMLFNVRYKDLSVDFLHERYNSTQIDCYGDLCPDIFSTNFSTYDLRTSYKIKFSDKLSLIPQMGFRRNVPWLTNVNVLPADPIYYNLTSDRATSELKLNYIPLKDINLLLGVVYEFDRAEHYPTSVRSFQGSKDVKYHDLAVYAEGTARNYIANPTFGIRYEYHNRAGSSIVPRFGVTKILGDFHLKFVYNKAFRTPGIEQFNGAESIGIDLKPEKTTVIEAEGGYNHKNFWYITANFFDIKMKDPIVYLYDEALDTDTYRNLGRVGTRGVETESRISGKKGYAAVTYSFYAKTDDDTNLFYTDPLNDNRFIAFPQHKLTAHGNLKLYKNLSISPSIALMTSRSAYTSLDGGGTSVASEIGADVLCNLFLFYEDIFTRGFNLGLGIYDIFNQKPPYIQAYDGYHAPLPGSSRELAMKLSYEWGNSKK